MQSEPRWYILMICLSVCLWKFNYIEILETHLIGRKDALIGSRGLDYGRLKLQRLLYCTLVLPLFFEGSDVYVVYQKKYLFPQSVLLEINDPNHHLMTFFFFLLLLFFFSGPHLWYIESPGPGVKEVQLLAHTTARAILGLNHICDLHQSLWQHWILNPQVRPRIKPVSLWMLVGFLTLEPQQKLLMTLFLIPFITKN